MTTPTILPVVTPQQQMALAFRDFPLPQVEPRGNGFVAYTIREDGEWVEFFGRDPLVAVEQLARLIVQRPSKNEH